MSRAVPSLTAQAHNPMATTETSQFTADLPTRSAVLQRSEQASFPREDRPAEILKKSDPAIAPSLLRSPPATSRRSSLAWSNTA